MTGLTPTKGKREAEQVHGTRRGTLDNEATIRLVVQ